LLSGAPDRGGFIREAGNKEIGLKAQRWKWPIEEEQSQDVFCACNEVASKGQKEKLLVDMERQVKIKNS